VTRLLLVLAFLFYAAQVSAQNLALNPAAESPHWAHIRIFDYARTLFLASLAPADYQWYADHLDAIEVQGNGAAVRAYNPTSEMFSYWFDMSAIQTDDFTGLAESGFLHFSENTTVQFYAPDNTTLINTVSITGCPVTAVSGCRVQTYLWDSARYVFDPQSSAFRAWHGPRILGSTNGYGYSNDTSTLVWLDEHAPGFSWPFSMGFQTRITAGGGIKEFGGRKPYTGTLDESFETDYGTALTAWLSALATQATSANKKVLINTNIEAVNTAYGFNTQATTIKGMATEGKHKPDGFTDAADYAAWITLANTITTAGGIVDLSTEWCTTGPVGYTAGNYSSAAERFRMWRLASYYHFKEPTSSSGRVYFNPGFCSNNTPTIDSSAADQANWAPAYQVDVGQPVGPTYTYAAGTVGACSYTVYARLYTKALTLVRPKDSASCNTYDDTTIATVTFASAVWILPHSGDISGQPKVHSFGLRNAESVIAMFPPQSSGAVGTLSLMGKVVVQ